MVHGGLVEEALQLWRDGERLLEELPPLNADHETVSLHIAALRAMYQSLTSQSATTKEQIAECERQLAAASATLRSVREKLREDGTASSQRRRRQEPS